MNNPIIKYYDARHLPVCYQINGEIILSDNFLQVGKALNNADSDIDHKTINIDFERFLFEKFKVRGANINTLHAHQRIMLIALLSKIIIRP